jgi:hypothetical protein
MPEQPLCNDIMMECVISKKTAMKSSVLILLAIALTTFSCSKEEDDREGCFFGPNLTGTWKWMRSEGGLGGGIKTPASTGKSVNIALNNDLRYFIYTNGILSSQGTYRFVVQNCIHDHTNKQVIDFSNDPDMMIEKMDSQTLELSDNMYDGFRSSYVKE